MLALTIDSAFLTAICGVVTEPAGRASSHAAGKTLVTRSTRTVGNPKPKANVVSFDELVFPSVQPRRGASGRIRSKYLPV